MMTGEQLYMKWVVEMGHEGIEVDPWEAMAEHEQAAWDNVAESMDAADVADPKPGPVFAPHYERYLTGARMLRAIQLAEEWTGGDGPGIAAHQIEALADIPEAEVNFVASLLVGEGYATMHVTENGTVYWRLKQEDPDEEPTS